MTWSRLPASWAALAAYSLLAVAVFSNTWLDPSGSWIGSPKDPQLFIWYLGWIPHQLSQGRNPLFTDFLSYPAGVNLMWNTSMLFPAVLLWPVTAVFGPVVAYNLLITGRRELLSGLIAHAMGPAWQGDSAPSISPEVRSGLSIIHLPGTVQRPVLQAMNTHQAAWAFARGAA